MTDSGSKAYAATPAATLEQRIMDCNIPKSEAEHWASKEITALRAEVEALRAGQQAAVEADRRGCTFSPMEIDQAVKAAWLRDGGGEPDA